jgi:hypothetical protein
MQGVPQSSTHADKAIRAPAQADEGGSNPMCEPST